jgi:hypothetical protein
MQHPNTTPPLSEKAKGPYNDLANTSGNDNATQQKSTTKSTRYNSFQPVLDNMHNHVPFNTLGDGLWEKDK